MSYQIDIINTWLNNNIQEKYYQEKYLLNPQSTPLISNLITLFINTVAYINLTKQEALDTISYILYDVDNESIHNQLLDCFLENGLLITTAEDYLTFNFDKISTISGVFLPLAKCYSPSCHTNNISCYSSTCPNKRISALLHAVNHDIVDAITDCDNKISKDWIENIPLHIRNSTNRKELKRQAGIAELLLTEKNYCQDLDILHCIYAIPLLDSNDIITNPSRRQRFYTNVFSNYLEISNLHRNFYNKLISHNRQSTYFVGRIGSIILQHVTDLIEPYIQYASHHIKAMHCLMVEHKNNAQFAKFLVAQNAQKCTRRLGLRHYLTSPTLWIGKFKLMLEAILKNTTDDADQLALKTSITILHDTLCKMNHSASINISSHDFRFEELSTSIYYQPPGTMNTMNSNMNTVTNDLQLLTLPEKCKLIREEIIWLARSTHPLQPLLCHLFLFSHALILTHSRVNNGRTEYIVLPGSPIPIPFLMLDSNATSMIRRLSFASTSMVSTPIHLLNNIRRQKSINSDASSMTNDSADSGYYSQHSTTKFTPVLNETDVKEHATLDQRVSHFKTKLVSKFNSFKTAIESNKKLSASRRDTTRLLHRSKSQPIKTQEEDRQQKRQQQQQQTDQKRALKISHLAFLENAFKLEFLSRSDRLIWENLIRDIISQTENNKVFKVKMICKSLFRHVQQTTYHQPIQDVHDSHQRPGIIGKIQCSFAFVYNNVNFVAFGTLYGIWIGPQDGSCPFYLVLPNQDIQQMNMLKDKLIVSINYNKQNMLISYGLQSMIESFYTKRSFDVSIMDWCMIKRSFVICFTVGNIRNQPVIVYLTRRAQVVWLVIIVPNEEDNPIITTNQANIKNHWFKKYKTEYKVSVKDPTSVQIIYDSIFVQSDRYGIERIDLFNETINDPPTCWVYMGPNNSLLSSGIHGTVCDVHYAFSISLFEQDQTYLNKIKFESQVNHVAMVHPYILGFSSSVIEVRNIQTAELVQVLRGNRIRFLSIMNNPTQPLFFEMANTTDPRITSIFQLQLTVL